MPMYQSQNGFMGFEVGMFNRNRQNQMHGNMMQMDFNSSVGLQFHYNNRMQEHFRLRESTLQLKRWNQQNHTWELVSNASFDTINNLVTFSGTQVNGYYMLAADQTTGKTEVPERSFQIAAFPNPASNEINLSFDLPKAALVKIELFDIAGKRRMLVPAKQLSAGFQTLTIPVSDLNSGIYFLRLGSANLAGIKQIIIDK